MTDFNAHVKSLVDVSMQIHEKLYKSTQNKLWMVWIMKFLSTYTKAGKPAAFHEMFNKFYLENQTQLNKNVFNSDGIVEDGWLKEGTSNSKDSWSSKDAKCKGKVIFFDASNPKLTAISIPISEIYAASIKLYNDTKDSDPGADTYPALLLMHLYNILYEVTKVGKLSDNAKSLSKYIEEFNLPPKSEGGALDGMSGYIKSVLKNSGLKDTDTSSEEMDKSFKQLLNKDVLDSLGKAMSGIISKIDPDQPKDVKTILSTLGKALQEDDIKSVFSDIAEKTSKENDRLIKDIPSAQE